MWTATRASASTARCSTRGSRTVRILPARTGSSRPSRAAALNGSLFTLADGPVPLLSMSKARLVSEMNRTVLRYMSNNPFPKLVPCLQPPATSGANTAPGLQAPQANVTCTLTYTYVCSYSA